MRAGYEHGGGAPDAGIRVLTQLASHGLRQARKAHECICDDRVVLSNESRFELVTALQNPWTVWIRGRRPEASSYCRYR
jgi:hypothetical protein